MLRWFSSGSKNFRCLKILRLGIRSDAGRRSLWSEKDRFKTMMIVGGHSQHFLAAQVAH